MDGDGDSARGGRNGDGRSHHHLILNLIRIHHYQRNVFMIPESVLYWRCHGAASESFIRNLKVVMSTHKPKIIALLEPRISGEIDNKVCKKIGKRDWCRVKVEGFSIGIWVLWDGDVIDLHTVNLFICQFYQEQGIHDFSQWRMQVPNQGRGACYRGA